MKIKQFCTTGRTTLWMLIVALSTALLSACAGVQIERASADNINDAGYQSYSWRDLVIENAGDSDDPLYEMGLLLRASVDNALARKGYLLKETDGDFLVSFEFRSTLSGGISTSKATNVDPVPHIIVNRGADPAMIDNAYALSGVRELKSILLNFEDPKNQSLMWMVSMSKIVDNINRNNFEKVNRTLGKSVDRALIPLTDAEE